MKAKSIKTTAKQSHERSSSSTVKQINGQTPGPLSAVPTGTPSRMRDTYAQSIALVDADHANMIAGVFSDQLGGQPVAESHARLLAASFNAFNRAGRALGIDAAELAEGIDLAAVITALRHARLLVAAKDCVLDRAALRMYDAALASLPPSQSQQTPAPAPSAPKDAALLAFIDTVEATGGVTEQDEEGEQGGGGPAGDPEWLDLGEAYRLACAALGRKPVRA